ncbi:hypothetical protein NLI96_g13374 [Meripilus lineatus]|uniref:Tyr recombinase domain-containing protein n=1 Tax=Meripilus lineatus TaxID=2056292 RepID=A0AAD5YBK3_9APHY|nr:hypothetical protein NLI96_g13374 [Physisporinus lineatus]
MRAGELTVKDEEEFSPAKHIRRGDVVEVVNPQGLVTLKLHPPVTKTSQVRGEDTVCAPQADETCPRRALAAHYARNNPGPNEHLFAHNVSGEHQALKKKAFLRALAKAASAAGIKKVHGHAFRIGGTLEYLLRGNSFETVKTHGRWKSDAFQRYLRRHALILAPHLQDVGTLQHDFIEVAIATDEVAEDQDQPAPATV